MNTNNNIVEVKRSWWYKSFRSIGMFCYKYWWLILLLLIAAIIFFWFYISKLKQKEQEYCKQYAIAEQSLKRLDSLIENCTACNVSYIDTIIRPDIDTSAINNGPATACDFESNYQGEQGQTETKHSLGNKSGIVNISYDMYDRSDKMDVYYDGQLVATTSRLVSRDGNLTFKYNAQKGKPDYCVVVMTAPLEGTAWTYTVHCPN
jgi:hypothetical protein